MAATVGTTVLSLAEGLGEFGESVMDAGALIGTEIASIGTGIVDGGQALYYSGKGTIDALKNDNDISNSIKSEMKNYNSATGDMWEGTRGFVAKERVKSAFDEYYRNPNLGKSWKETSYGYGNIRKIGGGVGYVGGIVALSILTFGVGGAAVGGASAATSATAATAYSFLGDVKTDMSIPEIKNTLLKDGIYHESLHQLSNNPKKNMSGFRSLQKTNGKYSGRGLNDAVTEYFTTNRPQSYYSVTGDLLSSYSDGVSLVRGLVKTGYLDEDKLFQQYILGVDLNTTKGRIYDYDRFLDSMDTLTIGDEGMRRSAAKNDILRQLGVSKDYFERVTK